MPIALATACFAAAISAALLGVVTEYRQTWAEGPAATIGTMQWSPAAALFSLLGLLALPISLDWWWYPTAFLTVLFGSGWAIMRAGKRRD
jgi:ABC-type proline/glycine betaine transport system permease subunit